jgi:Sigma-70, region 4
MSAAASREERQQQAIDGRLHGATYAEIGEVLGISGEAARRLVQRAWTKVIDALEMELMVARKTGDVLALPIPFGEAFEFEIERARLTVEKLRERGVQVEVGYAPKPDGLVLSIADVTRYGEEKNR